MEISDGGQTFEWWDLERKDPGIEVSRKLATMMGGHIKAITNTKLQLKIKTEEASENLSSMLIEPPKTNQGTKLVIVLSERGTY